MKFRINILTSLFLLTLFCCKISFSQTNKDKVIGKYHYDTMNGASGGNHHYLTIRKNGLFKVVVKSNHWTDGYKAYGTWVIENDSIKLNCNKIKKGSIKMEYIFECRQKYLIKENQLCITQDNKGVITEYCYIKK